MLAALVASCLLAVTVSACGSGDETTSTTTSSKTVELRPEESADPLPKLDRGWEVVHSRSGGFVVGRPPGWQPQRSGSTLTLLAPDRLVAVTISADRTASGLAIPSKKYVTRAASSLKGYKGELKPSKARAFKQRYAGSQVVERARSKSGVPQEIRVIVLRRDRLVTFTAVIARNSKRPDAQENKQALEIVGTVRSRPAGSGGSSPKNRAPGAKSSGAKKKPAKAGNDSGSKKREAKKTKTKKAEKKG